LHPKCEFQHPVFNYSLDIALVEEKIAIEYDGYYHFNCKESIDYHNMRQEKIEKEGWKFLRYTIFDKFPDTEQLQNDIGRILK
jgi:very-short-patch-repair endonuclease